MTMEMLSSQLIGLLAQTKEADPGMARVSVFVEGVNRLRPDLHVLRRHIQGIADTV
jgi:hypothetical protein